MEGSSSKRASRRPLGEEAWWRIWHEYRCPSGAVGVSERPPPGRRKPGRVTKAGCLTDDARRSSVLPQSVPPQKEKRSWSSIRRLLATLPPPPPGPPPPKPELMPVGWPNCGELRFPTNPPGL